MIHDGDFDDTQNSCESKPTQDAVPNCNHRKVLRVGSNCKVFVLEGTKKLAQFCLH